MNVLIIQNFGGIGGGSRSCFDVANLFRLLGCTVKIALPNPDLGIINLAKKEDFEIVNEIPPLVTYNFHNASGFALKTIIKYFKERRYLKAWDNFFKNAEDFDLVILNSSVLAPLISVVKKNTKKCYVFVRETHRGGIVLNSYLKSKLKRADSLFFLTNYDLQKWNVQNSNNYVIPEIINQSSNSKYEPSYGNRNNLKLLFLGGLSYYKGVLIVLKAIYRTLKKRNLSSNTSLTILGSLYNEYDCLPTIQKFFKKRHIAYRNKCLAYIELINNLKPETINLIGLTSDISIYYSACDAVVFSAKKVHQPRPAYEAGLYRKPIILPNLKNFSENVVDGYNGFVYKNNSVNSLCQLLDRLTVDKTILKTAGNNNHKATIENHSVDYCLGILKSAISYISK